MENDCEIAALNPLAQQVRDKQKLIEGQRPQPSPLAAADQVKGVETWRTARVDENGRVHISVHLGHRKDSES